MAPSCAGPECNNNTVQCHDLMGIISRVDTLVDCDKKKTPNTLIGAHTQKKTIDHILMKSSILNDKQSR